MSYAASYALFNYTLDDPSKGLEYLNLRLVRAFERGLDPKSSEAGFVLTHVDMVKDSPMLIRGSVRVLEGLEGEGDKRANVNDGLREVLQSMEKIESSMEGKSIHPSQSIYPSSHADKDNQICGRTPSHLNTFLSVSSSSESLPSPCSPTVSSTRE